MTVRVADLLIVLAVLVGGLLLLASPAILMAWAAAEDARQRDEAKRAPSVLVSDSWDADRPRAAAAVALAEAVVAPAPPSPTPPPPTPPKPPSCACGGKCTNGVYRPDGRIRMECDKDCGCGCRKKVAAQKCSTCLGTGNVMGSDGIVRRCRACGVSGTYPSR